MWKAFNSLFPLNTPLSEILPLATLGELETAEAPRPIGALGGAFLPLLLLTRGWKSGSL